jgi:hypothetical protein
MNTPDPIKEQPVLSAAEAVPALQTGEATAAIRTLLGKEQIEDPGDRKLMEEALAFLDAPTNNLSDIQRIAEAIGEAMAYGQEHPSFDALNRRFQTLLFQYYLDDATTQLTREPRDLAAGQHALTFALDIAKTFSKGYLDDSLLKQALALKTQVERL